MVVVWLAMQMAVLLTVVMLIMHLGCMMDGLSSLFPRFLCGHHKKGQLPR